MASARRRSVPVDGRAAARLLRAPALLRAGPAGGIGQVAQSLTLVTYNVRAGIGPGPFPPSWWTRIDGARLDAMAAVCVNLGADVICLEEVALASVGGTVVDQPARFAAATGYEVRYGATCALPLVEPQPSGRIVGTYLWGNVILSRLPIESTALYALPVIPDDDPADPVDTEPRCALACRIGAPAGPVTVLSTHFAWLGARARRAQAESLAEIVAGLPGTIVLGGDLNAPVEAQELASLTARLSDGFAAQGVPPGDTRRESCGRDRIDHVLARGVTFAECRVVTEAGDLSDHWPVLARLAI